MKRIDPLFAYLAILAVIQPARIQDIEKAADGLLGSEATVWLVERGLLRVAHDNARDSNLVIAIKRGVYFLTPKARQIVRREGLEESIDNSRMFLMKAQRRRYR